MKKLLFILSLFLAFLAVNFPLYLWGIAQYSRGYDVGYASYEPKIVFVPEVEVVVVEIETIVIKEVQSQCYLREFQNFAQLGDYIKSLDIEAVKKPWWDCDDYAYYLWVTALGDGWLMSFQSEEQGEELHALNNTVIGNTVYFIDLQAKKIWTRSWLD